MLTYDRIDTHIGKLIVVQSRNGICYIGLPGASLDDVRAWAARQMPGQRLEPSSRPFHEIRGQLIEYLTGRRAALDLPLDHCNSPFSRSALEAARKIPVGSTATYGEIARTIGRPRAARAVGRAMATNPLPLVFPCHRVIGADGSLTGFGPVRADSDASLALKAKLLRLESRVHARAFG